MNFAMIGEQIVLNWMFIQIIFQLRSILIATWSSPRIERQKIETWNLRNSNWELFRNVLKNKLDTWRNDLPEIVLEIPQTLDEAVESWTKCVVEAGEMTIGFRTTFKGSKSWWSDHLFKLRKHVQKLKNRFRKQRTPRNFQKYKESANKLKRKLKCEKHEHMVKSINSLHDGNIRSLFTQFKALNTNKISIIPALVNKETNSIAQTDLEKAALLSKTFSEPPQPPRVDDMRKNIINWLRMKLEMILK